MYCIVFVFNAISRSQLIDDIKTNMYEVHIGILLVNISNGFLKYDYTSLFSV